MSLYERVIAARETERAGHVAQAEKLYRDILADYPEQPDALYRLGLIVSDAGQHEAAIDFIHRAIAAVPKPFDVYYFNLGRIHNILKQYLEAIAAYDEVIKLNPSYAEAHINRSIVLQGIGRHEEALEGFQKALAIAPQMASVYYGLGNLLRETGKRDEAIRALEKAMALAGPDDRELRGLICNNLGIIMSDSAQYMKAETYFKEALACAPETAKYLYNFSIALRNQGRQRECLELLRRALEIDPLYVEARWAYAMVHIPLLFDRGDDLMESRRAFVRQLEELDRWFDQSHVDLGAQAVGTGQPFFIAYQEENNRDILMKYGTLCARLMKNWSDKKLTPYLHKSHTRRSSPIKVGIVSAHFFDHSVWRALIKGWLLYLDPKQIEIHLFNTGLHQDSETEWAKSHSASFQVIGWDLEKSARAILEKDIDILIYPDIGMDPLVVKLASLRLCSVQMVTWGHPETSGLPTIDYYISAEAFEPPEADGYYSEKLIRLSHLGCCYQPISLSVHPPDLEQLGIKKGVPLLLSPGLSFKYSSPRHDHVFVDIVRKIGSCQIVFFRTHDFLSNRLHLRIKAAFEEAGLRFEDSCVFIPVQKQNFFMGLMQEADVFLDVIGFSGFNTCIQAVECGLPVVTREGRFMRSRLASGILHRMGLSELVVASNKAYVDKVVELVKKPAYRDRMRKDMIERRACLFDDHVPIKELQKLFMNLARSS